MSPVEAPQKPDTKDQKDREATMRGDKAEQNRRENFLQQEKVHLGPGVLIVKTKQGELLAEPGMIVLYVNGEPGVLSQEVYEHLGGDYAKLLRTTYLEGAIARRRDDGLPELTKEELAEVEKNYDETQGEKTKAAADKKERAEKAKEKPAVWASSKNAPPTATPTETGTIAPNPDLPAPPDFDFPVQRKDGKVEPQESGTPPRTVTTPQTAKPVPPGSNVPGDKAALPTEKK
jgi:hypothetical protein